MTLQEQIASDLKGAMKAGNEVAKSALRMLQAEFVRKEIELGKKGQGLSDDEALHIVAREVKKRKESIAAYQKGAREDLVAQEERERAILEKYMPSQLSDEELEAVVRKVLETQGAPGPGDMGRVMQGVMAEVRGKADGTRVRAVVEKLLR